MTPQPVPYFIHRMIWTVARFDAVDLGLMYPEVTNGLSFLGALDVTGLLVKYVIRASATAAAHASTITTRPTITTPLR
jgi:hypothetical protein